MSLKGNGAPRDRYEENERGPQGRHSNGNPRETFDSGPYSGSYDMDLDDSYRRRGKSHDHDDTRYNTDSEESREFPRTPPPNRRVDDRRIPKRRDDEEKLTRDRNDHRRPEGKYATDSPSRRNDSIDFSDEDERRVRVSRRGREDSSRHRPKDQRYSPPSRHGRQDSPRHTPEDQWYSPPSRHGRQDSPRHRPEDQRYSPPSMHDRQSPHRDRNNDRRFSPSYRHRIRRETPSPRYEDPWDTHSNGRNDRPRQTMKDRRANRRRSPRYRNRDGPDSSSDRSGSSLDTRPSRRKRSALRDSRNSHANKSRETYDDPWDSPCRNILSGKDKSSDKPHDSYVHPSHIPKPLESSVPDSSLIGVPQRDETLPQRKDKSENAEIKDGHVKVDLQLGMDKPLYRNHRPPNTRPSVDNSYPSQSSKVNGGEPFGGNDDEAKLVYGQDENEERGNWTGKFDFILSMIGYAVGLGNIWRFPYLCYRNGGGAFLFPFLLMMATVGLPVFYLEAALGQFSSCGAMTCWHFAPLFKGLGIAMVAVSGITSVYYNMIIGWSLHYLFSSFTSDLPFASCQNKWNTENCKLKLPVMTCVGDAKAEDGRCLDASGKETGLWNKTLFTEITGRTLQSSSQEYWERFVLNFSDGIEHYGQPKWDLVLCLLLAWVICFLCLIKGIKTTGKVVYFTALFPYVVLIILLFRGITLDNADIGIKYFITPNFARLADASVWKDAANQVFFSMSIAGGGLITLSSYNRFHNNILRDSIIVAVGDSGTCILGGFVIFSYLGYMAGQLQVNIEDVAADGAGLAFVVYPEAVSSLPPPTLWAILFFLMLLTLGLDSQFAMVETVLTGMLDQFPRCRPRKTLVILAICIILFIFGLPLTCPGGMYLLQLMDNYVGGITLIIIGFIEIIALVFIYGVNRFCQDIHIMTGSTRFLFWKVVWRVLSPLIIAFIFVFMFVDYKPSTYDKYIYPTWADAIGWLMTFACVLAIPAVMVFKIFKEKEEKSIWQRIRLLCLPTVYWGPALRKHRVLVNYVDGFQADPLKGLKPRTGFVNSAFDNTPETSTKEIISNNQASLRNSRISIISATSKGTTATAKSGMSYESNV